MQARSLAPGERQPAIGAIEVKANKTTHLVGR